MAGWIVPGVLLALIPKCPACFAGYIALASGIGLSLPVAAGIRLGLIAMYAGALLFLIARRVRRRRMGRYRF